MLTVLFLFDAPTKSAVTEILIGLFVALAAAFIIWLVKRIFNVSKSQVSLREGVTKHEAPTQPRPDYKPEPSILKILQDYKGRTPYQREHFSDAYNGVPIEWPLRFSTIKKDNRGDYMVLFAPRTGGISTVISCENLDLSQYPRFKSLREGHNVVVRGVIDQVSDMFINLTKYEFDIQD
jgi:hypothetical protein